MNGPSVPDARAVTRTLAREPSGSALARVKPQFGHSGVRNVVPTSQKGRDPGQVNTHALSRTIAGPVGDIDTEGVL